MIYNISCLYDRQTVHDQLVLVSLQPRRHVFRAASTVVSSSVPVRCCILIHQCRSGKWYTSGCRFQRLQSAISSV